VGEPIEVTPEVLARLGEALVESVVAEARKDFAKQGESPTPKGQPEGLPASESFFESFDYKIVGKSTVTITCTWPWIEQIKEGRSPYRMVWLTRQRRVYKVPMPQKDGTVLIRMAPLRTRDAWIHPGFARHTFLERGVRKGRQRMAQIMAAEVIKQMKQGDPFR
jgi:hypothetical protein